MKLSAAPYLALALAASRQVLAANDWSTPCTRGQCSWDLPANSGAEGTVHIWGSSNAISDITPATGWQITSCDPLATAQDIELVCDGKNPDCDHLFQGGAVNTIVRLPDDCGPMPFARVAEHRVLQPSSASLRIRHANAPQVHVLTLDTDFAVASRSQNGNVNFALQGGSRNGIRRRNFITDGINDVNREINDSIDDISEGIHDAVNAVRDANDFNLTLSSTTTPIDFSGQTNLFKTTINCSADNVSSLSPTASAVLDVGASVHINISLGVAAVGTIIPPKFSEFGLYFGIDGFVEANMSIVANVSGLLSSGNIPIFDIGIPGLSFPGILDIGPVFKVTSEIDAKVELTDIGAFVNLKYDLNGVSFVFPPQASSQEGIIARDTSQVAISTTPDSDIVVDVAGHLTPQIDVGLSALGGIASATVFVELDAWADLNISTLPEDTSEACASANTGFSVGVGAEAAFFDLFDAKVEVILFKESDPLLQQKCFETVMSSSDDSTADLTNTAGAERRGRAPPTPRASHEGSSTPLNPRNIGDTTFCVSVPTNVKVVIDESSP